MRFLVRCVAREARKLLVVGVLFVLLLPVFVAWFEPVAHLRYHLGEPELIELDPSLAGAEEHAWVQVRGQPDPEAFAVRTGWVGPPEGYLFRLRDHPEGLLVWAPEGVLFDTLQASVPAEGAARRPDPAVVEQVVERSWTLRGRLYAGHDDWSEPFSEYLDADEIEAGDFVRDLGGALPEGPFGRDGRRWWLLVVGEDPSPERLSDGPLPVFGIGALLGLLGFGWLWRRVREESAPPEEPGFDRHARLMAELDERLLDLAACDPRVDDAVVERVRHDLGELATHELALFTEDDALFRGLVRDRT